LEDGRLAGSEATECAWLPDLKYLFVFFRRLGMKLLSTLFVACGLMTVSIANAAVDAAAAQALVKESCCLTCHSVDKMKIGQAFKDVA
jgi:hypothetical protein